MGGYLGRRLLNGIAADLSEQPHAEEPEDGRGKVVFYIGPGNDRKKRAVLEEVFPSMEREDAPMLITHNGGFDAFAAECLKYADPLFT